MDKTTSKNKRSILTLSYTLKKEFFRKTIHIMSAFVPFFYYYYRSAVMIGLLLITLLYLISEVLRTKEIKIPIITQVTEIASRSRDEGKIVLGPITLSIGIFLAFALFNDYRVAVISIFALSFGDGVASLFGKTIGGFEIPFTFGKRFSGTLGCFFVLLLVYMNCGLILKHALLIALAASIIEAFPTGDYDNLLIPVGTGLLAKYVIL